MRMISNEELNFVAGGSYLDEREPSFQALTASDFSPVAVNFYSLNNYHVAVAPTYVEAAINTSMVCGGTGLTPSTVTIIVEQNSASANAKASNTGWDIGGTTSGGKTTTTIVCTR